MLFRQSQFCVPLEAYHCIYNSHERKIMQLSEQQWQEYMQMKAIGAICMEKDTIWVREGIFVPIDMDEVVQVKKESEWLLSDPSRFMITILPTLSCNFRCQYCYEMPQSTRWTVEDSRNVINYVAHHARGADTVSVGWFGGEPTLEVPTIAKLSRELAVQCYRMGARFHGGMTTNGYLLDKETFRLLVRYGITHFHVTLDGEKVIHDKLRPLANGGPTYHIIEKNLREISQTAECERCRITIRVNVCKINLPYMDSFLERLASLFRRSPVFGLQFSLVSDYGGERIDNMREELLKSDCIDTLRRKAAALGLRMHDIEDSYLGMYGGVCYAAHSNHIAYCVGGHFLKCTCYLYDESNDIGCVRSDGSVNINESKLTMWRTLPTISNNCSKCPLFPVCLSNACPKRNVNRESHPCPSQYQLERAKANLGLLSGYKELVCGLESK